jgi:hypothetical protein
VGVAVLGLALAGCGGSDSDQMVRSGTPQVEQKADGRLTSTPAPLTVAEVEQQPGDSAQRAVMQAIFWTQWGNLPAVIDLYDDRIVDILGVARITGGYDYLRPELSTARPRVVSTRTDHGGQFVSIELASTRGAPAQEGFLLRRRGGVWRIVYDTLLERAIEGATLARLDPGDPTPDRDAQRSAARDAELYRSAYPSIARAERSG